MLYSNIGDVLFFAVDVGSAILPVELGGGVDGGTCIDWEDERRKKGIDDGVNRFDWPRLTEDVGLIGPVGGAAKLVLALESVPERLDLRPRSGVLEVVGAGVRTDPTDDSDARDVAEFIAPG